MRIRRKKVNYLSNEELLREINRSKLTFCAFVDPKYKEYDLIVENMKAVEKSIAKAKKAHVHKINTKLVQKMFEEGIDNAEIQKRLKKEGAKPSKIDKKDLVFRVMTREHIPMTTNKHGKEVSEIVNFPPFQHVAFINNKWVVVGKSHWQGDLATGAFKTNHGKMTNQLGMMFVELTKRYALKPNWRGYSYVDEMKQNALLNLSMVGLKFDESKSSNPFTYYTTIIYHSFIGLLTDEKKISKTRDELMQMNGYDPSFSKQVDHQVAERKRIENIDLANK